MKYYKQRLLQVAIILLQVDISLHNSNYLLNKSVIFLSWAYVK